ncbi:FAD dependent oxidoreductase-domain-containing protein [Pseudomassariella vexata]|uniref:FAD dependent oxidoreductase-domain-containing protein n=1 Tax=Pseudomassariella vexata TaxID=1141098 RepID=A0A1Y2DCA7_9PEZI|nr:FAD dependent oxidoreductase-domain-containing protein [Pseudomassariella vexata]ORY56901.1 FAD dependent oxidoreductase-domain-containing protein [Pseudomassariella vexata]
MVVRNVEAGSTVGITTEKSDAVLSVDEYASTGTDGHWTGFPKTSGQSLSYWLQGVRADPLLDHRTTAALPSYADTVIIGSGITGTLVAKHHLEAWPEKSVVVLEAREFCSGATGRNAGHCKPDQWRGFGKYEKRFGAEQAMKILQNEQKTWEDLVKYVQDEKVDCDLWVGDTLDVPMTKEVADMSKHVFERYKVAGGKVDHIKVTLDPAEAASISRIKEAQACFAWPASTLQPWKLTAHIMRSNLSKGLNFNLQTYTAARKVVRSEENLDKWVVRTDRGNIECTRVVHATNAYSAALEPSLRGLIRPTPHMCNKVIPPSTFAGSKALQNSYGVLLPDGALFSINPRCTADGIVLFGGSNPGQLKFDEWLAKHPERCTDDSLSGIKEVTDAVKSFAEEQLEGWTEAATGPGQLYDYSWSGIIGRSKDGVPFVGELPGLPGQWVCAGHNGHGMARVFTAAPGLVRLMAGEEWEEVGLPDVYRVTGERMERLKAVANV